MAEGGVNKTGITLEINSRIMAQPRTMDFLGNMETMVVETVGE